MSSATFASSGLLDSTAEQMILKVSDSPGNLASGFTGPKWICEECTLSVGPEPSEAACTIPLAAALDETAPTVALVSGPMTSIKKGAYAEINVRRSSKDLRVLAGTIRRLGHHLKGDLGRALVVDHRYLLAGLPVIGQFHISTSSAVSYRQGWRCVMNPGGEPNCTPDADGNPVFCGKRWGLDDGEAPPDELTSGKASYWTPQRAAQYFRYAFAGSGPALAQATFPEYPDFPDVVTWPETLESALDLAELGDRKAKQWDFEGKKINWVLHYLCEQAGPFGLYMKPGPDYKNTIQFVKMKYDGKGEDIARAGGGSAATTQNAVVVVEGNFEEDIGETYTKFLVAGELVYIERRVDTTGSPEIRLVAAWSDEDFADWQAFIDDPSAYGSDVAAHSEEAFYAACQRWPAVLCRYKLKGTWDFQAGTSQEGRPVADLNRPILPHLFSSFREGQATDPDALNSNPFPVLFEISDDDGANWIVVTDNDGFRILPQGGFELPGLRKASGGGGTTWTGSLDDPTNIVANDIRCTLAIPCDHRLTIARKLSTDPSSGVTTFEEGLGDEDQLAETLSRLYYADADELYHYVERKEAYPSPERAGGEELNDTIRDDSAKLEAHLKRRAADAGRVSRSGRLVYPHLFAAWSPGYMIRNIKTLATGGTYPIRSACRKVVLKSTGAGVNSTELVLS